MVPGLHAPKHGEVLLTFGDCRVLMTGATQARQNRSNAVRTAFNFCAQHRRQETRQNSPAQGVSRWR
jgi:hypothetical protein